MPFVNCFDVMQMVTDEASAQFAPLFCENKEAKAILHQYCDAIDVLAREFDEELYERSARGPLLGDFHQRVVCAFFLPNGR